MARPTTTHWTYERLSRIPDPEDGSRYEIIEGQLFMTPSPGIPHQRASRNLAFLMMQFIEAHDLGELFPAPTDVIFTDDTVLVPDIIFISKARSRIIEERAIAASPDLVVEVLSKSTTGRDRGIKLRTYATHGVREYWVLDPVHRSVEVFVLRGGEFVSIGLKTSGAVESPLVLAGFSAPLDRIFATPSQA